MLEVLEKALVERAVVKLMCYPVLGYKTAFDEGRTAWFWQESRLNQLPRLVWLGSVQVGCEELA